MPIESFFAPRHLHFNITNACNNRCIFCGSSSGRLLQEELSYIQIMEILNNLFKSGLNKVSFLGGEPLMKKGFIDILQHCFHNRASVSISTNGTLINEDILTILCNNVELVDTFQISLHSFSQETYKKVHGRDNYERVIKNIISITDHELPFNLAFSVGRYNIKEFIPLWTFASDCKAKYVMLTIFQVFGRGEEIADAHLTRKEVVDFLEFVNRSKNNNSRLCEVVYPTRPLIAEHCSTVFPNINFKESNCTAARTLLHLEADGIITPCPFLRESSSFANIFEKYKMTYADYNNIRDIWNGSQFKDFRDLFRPSNQVYNSCRKCKFFDNGLCTPCPLPSVCNKDCFEFINNCKLVS